MKEGLTRRLGEGLRHLGAAMPRLDPMGRVAFTAVVLLAIWFQGPGHAAKPAPAGHAVSGTTAKAVSAVSSAPEPAAVVMPPSDPLPTPAAVGDGARVAQADRATPSTRGADRPMPSPTPVADSRPAPAALSLQEQFIVSVVADAQISQRETGVPASVTLAQAMLESDLGRSKLTQTAKNYFGMKASGGAAGTAGVVYMDTWEVIKGANVTVRAAFRAYNTAAESFADHGRYLRDNKIYAEAMKHTDDARLFARLIHQAGYATDPQYSDKLIRIMDRYNLYQYDLG